MDDRLSEKSVVVDGCASKFQLIHKSTTQQEEHLSRLSCGEIIERSLGFLVDSFLSSSTLTEAVERWKTCEALNI